MKKIVFATGNKGKVKEVCEIFSDTKIQIIPMSELGDIPEIVEDGLTFEDNAFKKAKFIFTKFGLPTIADDSGLAIEQLGGKPGVISARYAGEGCTFDDNNKKVLKELEGLPEPHKAQFVSLAIFYNGRKIERAVGKLHGRIIKEFRGSHGFGYDPIFVPDGYTTTLAEMTLDEKNKIRTSGCKHCHRPSPSKGRRGLHDQRNGYRRGARRIEGCEPFLCREPSIVLGCEFSSVEQVGDKLRGMMPWIGANRLVDKDKN